MIRLENLVTGMIITLLFSVFCFSAENIAGRAVSVAGNVLVYRAESNPVVKKILKKGEEVLEGHTVETGANGQVKLLLNDKTIIDLTPNSTFKLDEFKQNNGIDRKVQVSVKSGTLRSTINKAVGAKGHFRFKTSGTTMGVRGTEILIETPPVGVSPGAAQKEALTVLSGRVELQTVNSAGTLSSPLSVSSGQSFQGGQLVQLPPDVLQKKGADSTVKDNTFENAVKIGSSDGDKRDSLATLGENFAAVRSARSTEIGDLKIPGMFGRDFIKQHQQNFNSIGRPVRVNVGFVR